MTKIAEFQVKNGLKPDGVIGKKTLSALKTVLKISNDERLAHFMGQCHTETGGFKSDSENLRYTKERLLSTFKHDFDINKDRVLSATERAKADTLVGHPDKIANFVYANQNGNGNEASGDGWKHRGFGSLQLTGYSNQLAFSKFIGDSEIMNNPSLIATKYYFESAIFFFNNKKLWAYCDKVDTNSIIYVSKRVNGGTNGLDHRIKWTNYYINLLRK